MGVAALALRYRPWPPQSRHPLHRDSWQKTGQKVTLRTRLVGKDGAVDHVSPSSLFDPSRKNFGHRLPESAMHVNQILCLLSGCQTKGTGSDLGAITLFEPRRPRLYCDGMV